MITLFVIYCNTSPTPIGFSPGFLSNGIKSHARNASKDNDKFSAVHTFVITSAEVLHKSVVLSPNWVDANSLFQPSASSSDGPASPLVLNVAFLTLSASIEANLNGFTSSGLSVNNTSESALRLGGCYCFSCCNAFSVWGRVSFSRLSVSSLIALWTFPFSCRDWISFIFR